MAAWITPCTAFKFIDVRTATRRQMSGLISSSSMRTTAMSSGEVMPRVRPPLACNATEEFMAAYLECERKLAQARSHAPSSAEAA